MNTRTHSHTRRSPPHQWRLLPLVQSLLLLFLMGRTLFLERAVLLQTSNNNDDEVGLVHKKPEAQHPTTTLLCDECLDIVRKAPWVNTTFEPINPNDDTDTIGGPVSTYFRGALDEHGNPGYVADETVLRHNPPAITMEELQRNCTVNDTIYTLLTQRVQVIPTASQNKKSIATRRHRTRILCLSYTIEPRHDHIRAIGQTWGYQCDGYLAASNTTDTSIGAIHIPHLYPESYKNLWQKLKSAISYVYDNYYERYDWFVIAGDDNYFLMENMRAYLESEEIRMAANGGRKRLDAGHAQADMQVPLLLGHRFRKDGDAKDVFLSGGPGHTMNRAALKTLVVDAFPRYFAREQTTNEDVLVARSLRAYGVYPYPTRDASGAERYLPMELDFHLSGTLANPLQGLWYASRSFPGWRQGLGAFSVHSIAFHYVKPAEMRKIHALLYGACPKNASIP